MIYVYFDPTDMTRIVKALDRVAFTCRYQATEGVPRRLARQFVVHLIESIGTQRYAINYQPYGRTSGSQRYYEWKQKHSINPDMFWYLLGDLVKNLHHWKIPGVGWFAGIPSDVTESRRKSWGASGSGRLRNIAAYGWIMEEGGTFTTRTGTQDHPARPLFVPAFGNFSWNIAPLELNRVVPLIEGQWS
jgi:hypothetical protein